MDGRALSMKTNNRDNATAKYAGEELAEKFHESVKAKNDAYHLMVDAIREKS